MACLYIIPLELRSARPRICHECYQTLVRTCGDVIVSSLGPRLPANTEELIAYLLREKCLSLYTGPHKGSLSRTPCEVRYKGSDSARVAVLRVERWGRRGRWPLHAVLRKSDMEPIRISVSGSQNLRNSSGIDLCTLLLRIVTYSIYRTSQGVLK